MIPAIANNGTRNDECADCSCGCCELVSVVTKHINADTCKEVWKGVYLSFSAADIYGRTTAWFGGPSPRFCWALEQNTNRRFTASAPSESTGGGVVYERRNFFVYVTCGSYTWFNGTTDKNGTIEIKLPKAEGSDGCAGEPCKILIHVVYQNGLCDADPPNCGTAIFVNLNYGFPAEGFVRYCPAGTTPPPGGGGYLCGVECETVGSSVGGPPRSDLCGYYPDFNHIDLVFGEWGAASFSFPSKINTCLPLGSWVQKDFIRTDVYVAGEIVYTTGRIFDLVVPHNYCPARCQISAQPIYGEPYDIDFP